MVAAVESLIATIPYNDGISYAACLQNIVNFVFLDSAKVDATVGQYSYIGIDPFALLYYVDDHVFFNCEKWAGDKVFEVLADKLSQFVIKPRADLPPFQGGVAGFFGYDLAHHLEDLPSFAAHDKCYPWLALGFFDLVLALDHQQQKAWLISSGFPEYDFSKRDERAKARLDFGKELLSRQTLVKIIEEPLIASPDIKSNFTKENYLVAVKKAIEYIREGDIFEVNLSQRFECELPLTVKPFDLYRRIRHINPAPFSAYLELAGIAIVSSSPERFLKLHDKMVETRPIKGTIKRSSDLAEDRRLTEALVASEKNRAENTMIVDLMRNDLSRVCLPKTVHVVKYCGLESFETVHHLVSVVEGKLADGCGAIDLLKVAFPGGSVTGAPKIRAMEIIDELEPTERGPYCGSLGYIGFDGSMDTSIIIRSYVIKNQNVTFQVGGAIVLDSDPELEYEETLLKANALKQALTEKIVITEASHDLAD